MQELSSSPWQKHRGVPLPHFGTFFLHSCVGVDRVEKRESEEGGFRWLQISLSTASGQEVERGSWSACRGWGKEGGVALKRQRKERIKLKETESQLQFSPLRKVGKSLLRVLEGDLYVCINGINKNFFRKHKRMGEEKVERTSEPLLPSLSFEVLTETPTTNWSYLP